MDFTIPFLTTDRPVGAVVEAATAVRYQIGEAARLADVTQRTVRYYEKSGLLKPAERGSGGFRLYSDHDVEHIQLIRRLQSVLNLSLAEIGEMVRAEALLAPLQPAARSDRELAAYKRRLEVSRDALNRQSELVKIKLEQLLEMKVVIDERRGMVDRRGREIEAINADL